MGKKKQNINLGLSKEELTILVTNSKDAQFLNQYIDKLENCDLSRSAIELINEDDLGVVNRISDGVTSKYKTTYRAFNLKLLVGIVVLVFVISGIFLFKSGSSATKGSHPEVTSSDINNQKTAFSNVKENPTLSDSNRLSNSERNKLEPVSKIKETNLKTKSIDDFSKNDLSIKSEAIKRSKQKNETKKTQIESQENKKTPSEFADKKLPREVKTIQSMSQVPNKFKNENYSLSDLVDYNGGNKMLEKELWNKLKGQIKDSDIPKTNSSIVFKFTVTSKGKIKDVNIQSLVTLELEELIKETTLNLSSWNKGKKRIPVDYTVYITFK